MGADRGQARRDEVPALSEVMRPLNCLEANERELWQAAHEAWGLDCKVSAMQDDANEKKAKVHAAKGDTAAARQLLEPGDAPPEPIARSYIEIRGTTYIPRVCLALLGGTQPGKIQQYVRDAVAGGSGDDGLLQRFGLTVWPDIAGEFKYVDQWPDTPAKQTAWAVFERLAQLQPATDTEAVIWRFSPGAQALFIEWIVPGIVHETELVRALAMGDYLRTHANRLYAAAVIPETTNAATLLVKIKSGKLADRDGVMPDSFTPRQVALKHWAGLATPDAVRKAADVLADFEYLRRDVVQSADPLGRGRPSDRYLINPAVFKAVQHELAGTAESWQNAR
ncbi:MAG: DUF3987 domain-containing protein [Burkholderiales bacterium]|nr:DUF3987 domain-containing protein [Burkholderiales bacterium]